MHSHTLHIVALAAAIVATGLVTGVFLAFSDFVMRSFGLIPAEAGSEAMQVLNREVFRSIFIALLIGMSAISVVMAVYAMLRMDGPAVVWIVAGGVLYFVGTFLVTMVFNVPMNQKLDGMDPTTPATAEYWLVYLKHWTFWNSVRTVAPLLTMICYLVGFYHLARTAHP